MLSINGCINNSQKALTQNENNKINVKTIAVLPVVNKTTDSKTAQLLRSKLLEEIYFKGYSKIPLVEIDKKLESLYIKLNNEKASEIVPEALRDLVGADAGLYCTLTESKNSKIFYETVKITAFCALRNTVNGETVWNAKAESIRRCFNFTTKGLKKELGEDFDVIIDEIVNEIVKTLPDGPNLLT
jgi:hypothetical protein